MRGMVLEFGSGIAGYGILYYPDHPQKERRHPLHTAMSPVEKVSNIQGAVMTTSYKPKEGERVTLFGKYTVLAGKIIGNKIFINDGTLPYRVDLSAISEIPKTTMPVSKTRGTRRYHKM